jgi:CPA1 family monovalent cation:H+ antiporter
MELFAIVASLLAITALLAFLNERLIGLPTTIGVMLIALAISVVVLVLGSLGVLSIAERARDLVAAAALEETLMGGMLSFLLFAGALHVDLGELLDRWLEVGLFATLGVIVSTALVALAAYASAGLLGLPLGFAWCLVFGAIVAPTDPVAVLAILRRSGVGAGLRALIAGESLFNDGFAVVVFATLAGLAVGSVNLHAGELSVFLAQEALGGAALGLVLGWLGYLALRSIDSYQIEVLITLALVAGGFALAGLLHLSGPLAVVVMGLFIGNRGRRLGMSAKTREHLDSFWELLDEVLNAVLFVLIGLELLVLDLNPAALAAGAVAIVAVTGSRLLAVGGMMRLMRRPGGLVATWAGIRGGISVALALSLPAGPERELVLTMTYVVVVFSIAVQGLTLQPLASRRRSA